VPLLNGPRYGLWHAWYKTLSDMIVRPHSFWVSPYLRGLFKKRPNFLNNAPTNTESALRLLSVPSVRFWQQTAICPVSLWAFVVELYPLDWSREQAVRRISYKVTIKELEEQRVCVCVCVCNFAANLVKIVFPVFVYYSYISYESLKAKSLTQIISLGISSAVQQNKVYKEIG
jgi:hypothetical protein